VKIYTKAGELAFSTFNFPDGQPHFRLNTYEREFDEVTIETAIRNPGELFAVLLAADTLRACGYSSIRLDIRYLLGARMDRAIMVGEPFTLGLVARLLNGAGFSKVRILDAHSEVASRLIRNAVNVLPWHVVQQVDATLGFATVICPDHGAIDRVKSLYSGYICYCTKYRNPNSGNLSAFNVENGHDHIKDNACLIIDDICDGGATFVGLAKELRALGASKVYLYVTHGIFSKGSIKELDGIYTTNSYRDDQSGLSGIVTIPVSMRDLK
jgi:ribose-phosphate pyrophosphokinase